MNLSKSKYCNAICCNKMLWLDTYNPSVAHEIDNSNVFKNGKEVGEVAKGLFGHYYDIKFNENLNN